MQVIKGSTEYFRRKSLTALEARMQLGADPISVAEAMILCAAANVRPQKTWIEKLLRMLCAEQYMVREGDNFKATRSIPRLNADEEFCAKCLHPDKDTNKDQNIAEQAPTQVTEQGAVVEAEPQEVVPSDTQIFIERMSRLIEVIKALREEISRERQDIREFVGLIEGELSAIRTEADRNVTQMIELVDKAEEGHKKTHKLLSALAEQLGKGAIEWTPSNEPTSSKNS